MAVALIAFYQILFLAFGVYFFLFFAVKDDGETCASRDCLVITPDSQTFHVVHKQREREKILEKQERKKIIFQEGTFLNSIGVEKTGLSQVKRRRRHKNVFISLQLFCLLFCIFATSRSASFYSHSRLAM